MLTTQPGEEWEQREVNHILYLAPCEGSYDVLLIDNKTFIPWEVGEWETIKQIPGVLVKRDQNHEALFVAWDPKLWQNPENEWIDVVTEICVRNRFNHLEVIRVPGINAPIPSRLRQLHEPLPGIRITKTYHGFFCQVHVGLWEQVVDVECVDEALGGSEVLAPGPHWWKTNKPSCFFNKYTGKSWAFDPGKLRNVVQIGVWVRANKDADMRGILFTAYIEGVPVCSWDTDIWQLRPGKCK